MNMSKKELSRRDFLKGAAGAAGVAAIGMLAGCGSKDPDPTPTPTPDAPKGIYTPGTYTSKAQGAVSTVLVTMTFSADAITDVVLDVSGETASIGQAAAEELKNALMEKQSAEIDAVGGATLTSKAVMEAANKCIQQAKGEIPVEVITSGSAENGPADWLGTEPEVANVDETWDTDFLIVGAGNGGMCAGAYAAKHGVKFRIIEKGTGSARVRSWYGAIDSEDALALGEKPVDRAALRNELKRYSSGKCNLRTFETWITESADMHKFIKDCYAQYAPDAEVAVTVGDEAVWPDTQGFFFPIQEHNWGGTKMNRHAMFQQIIEEEGGVSIDFNTSLVKLEKTGNKVTGVIAQNTETGKYIRINAAKGVLIATGGYPFNPQMMEALDPVGTAVVTSNVAWPTDTGDGIKAGVWAGAAMQKEAAPMLFDRGIVAPGINAGYMTTSTGDKVFPGTEGQFNLGTQPFLKVNRRGERFTNESGTYDQMSYSAFNQPGGVYASIFDSSMPEDVKRFHTIGCSAQTRKGPERQLQKFEEGKNLDQNGRQIAFVADTLEELADKLGFTGKDKETFLATCARYNELYDKQNDEDFGKPAYRLSPLKTAPFYGFWLGAALLTTEQGLLIDEKARVVDETDRAPIEGLFATGDATGGFFVNNYPCVLPGIAMGRTMTFAIKAVKVANGLEG